MPSPMRSAPRRSTCPRRRTTSGPPFNTRTRCVQRPSKRRLQMYAFNYHRASGLRQATNMLGKLEDAKLLAGGQTLLPTMKQRLASPANLIDMGAIEGMNEIALKGR